MREPATTLILGVILLLISGFGLLYAYAFASMVDPQLQVAEFRAEVLRKMFRLPDAGLLTWPMLGIFLFGTFLIIRSVVQLARRRRY